MQNGANREPKIGRLRAAWHVLVGQRVTPLQIQADWLAYQCIFDDLLKRWSSYLARDARQEKKRIERLEGVAPGATPVAHVPQVTDTKQELRRRLASMRGFGVVDDIHQKPEVTNEPDSESGAV